MQDRLLNAYLVGTIHAAESAELKGEAIKAPKRRSSRLAAENRGRIKAAKLYSIVFAFAIDLLTFLIGDYMGMHGNKEVRTMIDITTEQIVTLSAAARRLPRRRSGRQSAPLLSTAGRDTGYRGSIWRRFALGGHLHVDGCPAAVLRCLNRPSSPGNTSEARIAGSSRFERQAREVRMVALFPHSRKTDLCDWVPKGGARGSD